VSGNTMHQETLDVLRHVAVNGPRTRDEVKKAFPNRANAAVALSNLAHLGYLVADDSTKPITYALSGKGRKKLEIGAGPLHSRRDPAKLVADIPALPRARRQTPTGYQPRELAPCVRPGSMDAFKFPSRMGDTLRYRGGRVTDLAGNPITNP